MTLTHLDHQLSVARHGNEKPDLPDHLWDRLATTIHDEIASLDEATTNRLRISVLIPPERYIEELTAFQSWMDIAHANHTNPAIVRAQVMTELYVAFVWLRDSLMKPAATFVAQDSALAIVQRFLSTGPPRMLRNAIAHGRWCYLDDFGGLECWAEPSHGQPHQRFEINHADLDAWQLLSRGTAIATLLALAES